MGWLGTPLHAAKETKVQQVCSIVSEFALEYRTCRERVLQQIQKKATHRERNKTRGKMIIEVISILVFSFILQCTVRNFL